MKTKGRRLRSEIAVDRERIVQYVREHGYVRPQEWMRPIDIEALVKAGRLERDVRKEYDSQRGYAANLFGGAGVMVRHRAYLRIPK